MKTLLAHPTGNQFFRQLGAALHAREMLGRAATCLNLNWNWNGTLSRCLPAGARAELARRSFPEPWAVGMATRPWREAARLAALRLGWAWPLAHETGWCCVDAVYRDFDQWLARHLPAWQHTHGLGAVYAYEDGALAQFEAAKVLGLRRVYDLPIAHWSTVRRLLAEEAARLPAWAPTLGGGARDSEAKLARKDLELELADIVIVPSQFVADSLPPSCAGKRVVVAPFGSPLSGPGEVIPTPAEFQTIRRSEGRARPLGAPLAPARTARRSVPTGAAAPIGSGPLRVLFVGSMGQRKGLGDLFAAVRLLGRSDVELVVMGALAAPMEFYRRELPQFIFESGRSHDQVLALMRTCDVLVLPSIAEGRALVMQEAMSQGLPLIITPHTGGADLIEEGRTGFLVPIRRPDLVAEKIAWLADHRAEAAEMGRHARRKAGACTWAAYGETVCTALAQP
jgi:glycosyltransferase involved in cell wall biosynthesis